MAMTLTHADLDSLRDIWWGMIRRCEDPRRKDFKKYGGHGIRVCDEWHDFDVFRDWADKAGFRKGLTLDRVSNNKGYRPDNCRWISKRAQAYNRHTNTYICINGERRTLTQWAELKGLPDYVICKRRAAGWSDEDAVNVPKGHKRPKTV